MNTQDDKYYGLNEDVLSDEILAAIDYAELTLKRDVIPEDLESFQNITPEPEVKKDEEVNTRKSELNDFVFFSNAKKKGRKKKFMKKWKKILIIVVSVLLALIIALIGTGIYLYQSGKGKMFDDEIEISVNENVNAEVQESGNYIVTEDGKKYTYNKNITSILCIGVDEKQEEGVIGVNSAADAIFLVAIDTVTGKTNVINVSRDTMTDINVFSTEGKFIETRKDQLALAYAYGDGEKTSCENQVTAVRNLFYNIPINSYVSINLQGLEYINDYIGGVTVVSPETIGSKKWTNAKSYYFEEGKEYTLWGQQAHSFVRGRNFEQVDGNNGRMKRQMVYLNSFVNKVVSNAKKDVSSIVDLYEVATPYVCTNLNVNKVTYLAVNALKSNFGNFETRTVPSKKIVAGENDEAEFYIDEKAFFNDIFLDVFYTPVN